MHALDTETLGEVRSRYTSKLLEDGEADCPLCYHHTRKYIRNISGIQAEAFVIIARRSSVSKGGWVDVPELLKRAKLVTILSNRDWTRLQHWGLLEKHEGRREDRNPSEGLWRVTPLGFDYVMNRVAIPMYVTLLNNVVIDRSVDQLQYIKDIDSKNFDWGETMSRKVYGIPD